MQVTKEVVSVSEMARMLGLSRARFYQLMKQGVFPSPLREGDVKRSHFDRALQEQCVRVRQINQGMNGNVILFYARTFPTTPVPSQRASTRSQPTTRRQTTRQSPNADPLIRELRSDLAQLGVEVQGEQQIRTALADCFPDGHDEVDRGTLLRRIFEHMNRQNPPDNLAR
ncbi:MAG TPA: AlpA family phage regulatory protein [Phycisphaerae bacterium]|nr:AlpA family phage regulatory protein [Phycisphaerae bacterium]